MFRMAEPAAYDRQLINQIQRYATTSSDVVDTPRSLGRRQLGHQAYRSKQLQRAALRQCGYPLGIANLQNPRMLPDV